MNDKYCILNGDIIKTSSACISPFDRGFMYGDGVFDTMSAPNGRPFLFEEHLRRLNDNLKEIDITLPYSDEEMYRMITDLIKKNGLTGSDSYVRTTVTRGINTGKMFYTPTAPTLIIIADIVSDRVKKAREIGVKCIISNVTKSIENPIFGIKSLNFLWSVMSLKDAIQKSADECIFFNSLGFLSECSTSNIFTVKDGSIYTPNDDSAILPGVTRDYLIRLLDNNGIKVTKKDITREELMGSDEVFLTSAVRGVAWVSAINDKVFQADYTKKVQDIYFSSIK